MIHCLSRIITPPFVIYYLFQFFFTERGILNSWGCNNCPVLDCIAGVGYIFLKAAREEHAKGEEVPYPSLPSRALEFSLFDRKKYRRLLRTLVKFQPLER